MGGGRIGEGFRPTHGGAPPAYPPGLLFQGFHFCQLQRTASKKTKEMGLVPITNQRMHSFLLRCVACVLYAHPRIPAAAGQSPLSHMRIRAYPGQGCTNGRVEALPTGYCSHCLPVTVPAAALRTDCMRICTVQVTSCICTAKNASILPTCITCIKYVDVQQL